MGVLKARQDTLSLAHTHHDDTSSPHALAQGAGEDGDEDAPSPQKKKQKKKK
jgi:hypothetical protein